MFHFLSLSLKSLLQTVLEFWNLIYARALILASIWRYDQVWKSLMKRNSRRHWVLRGYIYKLRFKTQNTSINITLKGENDVFIFNSKYKLG